MSNFQTPSLKPTWLESLPNSDSLEAIDILLMHQLSKGYSDAQIEQLATYFAAQKK